MRILALGRYELEIKQLFSHRNWVLLKAMVSTDFKLRYQQSVLGYLWSILKPLMLFAIMYLVFVRFLRFGADVPHFAVALLLGTVMWTFFSEATTGGMMSVVGHGDLLRKIHFPQLTVTISAVMSALINFGINFIVVLIFMLVNGVKLRWTVLLIFPIIAELILISSGVAFFLGALYVYFRDLSPIWEVVMQAGFYATPIIYPLSLVVSNVGPRAARIMLLNPMAQIIQDARFVLVSNEYPVIWNSYSNIIVMCIPIIISILVFVFGIIFFNSKSKEFAELV